MGKKKTREKRNGRLQDIQQFCETYTAAEERLKRSRKRLNTMTAHQHDAISEFEKELYDQDIIALNARIKADEKHTGYFRWALFYLGERERAVLEQLYVEGCPWNAIVSEKGERLSVGAIDKARKRGLQQMAELIAEKKAQDSVALSETAEFAFKNGGASKEVKENLSYKKRANSLI